ncbi:MAG: hypothetical protein WKF59_15685 [Chitinophagaceae bacterium]
MSNDIINLPAGQAGQNADGQDPDNTQDAATQNTPVENSAVAPQEQTEDVAVAEQPASEKKSPLLLPFKHLTMILTGVLISVMLQVTPKKKNKSMTMFMKILLSRSMMVK